MNHFFGRLQIVCYENSSQLSSRVLLPQHGGDIIFQMCNAKSAPAIIVHDISILRNTSFLIAVFLGCSEITLVEPTTNQPLGSKRIFNFDKV